MTRQTFMGYPVVEADLGLPHQDIVLGSMEEFRNVPVIITMPPLDPPPQARYAKAIVENGVGHWEYTNEPDGEVADETRNA